MFVSRSVSASNSAAVMPRAESAAAIAALVGAKTVVLASVQESNGPVRSAAVRAATRVEKSLLPDAISMFRK